MLAQIHFFELERDPSFLGDDVGRKRACTRGIIELDETILSLIDRCKVVLSATPMFDAKCGLGVGLVHCEDRRTVRKNPMFRFFS